MGLDLGNESYERDYKQAIRKLYQEHMSRLDSLKRNYRSVSNQLIEYSMKLNDSTGRLVEKNFKEYDRLSTQKRQIAITAELTKKEISFLERFWERAGFNPKELNTNKQLRKTDAAGS